MISPSPKLRKLVELYESRADFCRRTDMDEVTLSRLLSQERGASSSHIEKVLAYTGWKFEEAFELTDAPAQA